MMKGKKILVVGLPLFAERFANNMQLFDRANKYVFLNTYYKKIDQLKFLRLINSTDLIYSINGSLKRSKVFDKAIQKKVPIIFNWAGSDVLLAIEAKNNDTYIQQYIDWPQHYAVAPWLAQELEEIGIHAQFLPYLDFEKKLEPTIPKSDRIKVVTYINKANPDFYGLKKIEALAKNCSNVQFNIVGMEAPSRIPNIQFYGWVNDMDEFINEHHVVLRLTKHDGLSNFILDGLSLGRTVIYNMPLNHCIVESSIERISGLLNDFEVKSWSLNQEAIHYMKTTFNKETVYKGILEAFEKVIETK